MIIEGYIKKGHHNFGRKYKVPGRDLVLNPPHLWPSTFEPGTVNFRINDDFRLLGSDNSITYANDEIPDHLHCLATPAAVFPPAVFQQGFHDDSTFVWRARLRVRGQDKFLDCWILRRKNATYKRQLELISDVRIRQHFDILDEDQKYGASLEILS